MGYSFSFGSKNSIIFLSAVLVLNAATIASNSSSLMPSAICFRLPYQMAFRASSNDSGSSGPQLSLIFLISFFSLPLSRKSKTIELFNGLLPLFFIFLLFTTSSMSRSSVILSTASSTHGGPTSSAKIGVVSFIRMLFFANFSSLCRFNFARSAFSYPSCRSLRSAPAWQHASLPFNKSGFSVVFRDYVIARQREFIGSAEGRTFDRGKNRTWIIYHFKDSRLPYIDGLYCRVFIKKCQQKFIDVGAPSAVNIKDH